MSRWGKCPDGKASLTPEKGEREGTLSRKNLKIAVQLWEKSLDDANGESPSKVCPLEEPHYHWLYYFSLFSVMGWGPPGRM